MAFTKATRARLLKEEARIRKVYKFAATNQIGPSTARGVSQFTRDSDLVSAAVEWLKIHRVKPNTEAGYRLVIRKFYEFRKRSLGLAPTLTAMNSVDVSAFITDRERTVSKHSARAAYITLKAFGKWLNGIGYMCDLSQVERVKHIPEAQPSEQGADHGTIGSGL